MNKKVLIISASPRKDGNSDTLCNEFLNGAVDSGNIAEKIFLADKNINFCTACGFCYLNDCNACTVKDDMAEILNKMIASDVIVFASPLYFYSINAQLKTFIDRLCAGYKKLTNKEFYYIFTAADKRPDSVQFALGEFKGLMSCLANPTERGYLFAGGVWKKGEILNTDYPKLAYKMGKSC